MPFKCFIHASVIKPLTYCFLAKGTLNAVMGFCRVTVTFGGLLFKAWGLFSLYVCRLDVKAIDYDGSSRFLSLSLSLSCSRPQIEKIMTLIGAGIDFSRDQQYATPGRVPSLLPFHAITF